MLNATLGAACRCPDAVHDWRCHWIGSTCNDEDLKTSFEAWANDRTMEQVHSWDFVTWLHDWAHDVSVVDLLHTAPAEPIAEARPTLDETTNSLKFYSSHLFQHKWEFTEML